MTQYWKNMKCEMKLKISKQLKVKLKIFEADDEMTYALKYQVEKNEELKLWRKKTLQW